MSEPKIKSGSIRIGEIRKQIRQLCHKNGIYFVGAPCNPAGLRRSVASYLPFLCELAALCVFL